ncbi:MAG: HPr kinase/phosphorylase [Aliihoeflea sp.]
MQQGNRHASLVLIGDRGVLITGPSGAGKSTLAIELIDRANGFAALVGDDRIIVEKRSDGRYVGSVPKTIAGQIEVRGVGIVSRPNETRAVIDLIVDLVDGRAIDRMPEPQFRDGSPAIQVPQRDCLSARQRVAEALSRLNS